MKKREFLKTAGILGAGALVAPMLACTTNKAVAAETAAAQIVSPVEFTLPALGYANNALEPAIDSLTMEIHHGKHHQAYVTNLNKAVAGATGKYDGMSIQQLCAAIGKEDTALRNQGGGHYNHSCFWNWIKPGGAKEPSAEVAAAIQVAFGNMDEFKKQFSEAAKTRFGSGWAWLSIGSDKKLFVSSTPNQDNPLMGNIVDKPGKPVLGIDVWEHAYYLNYQNKRPDYITAFMGIINWTEVQMMYVEAMK
jgi:superoxide dismutase, Fe-Mn family